MTRRDPAAPHHPAAIADAGKHAGAFQQANADHQAVHAATCGAPSHPA